MNYGFLGIFDRHDDPDAAQALASKAIAKATGCSDEDARKFLESIQGRYFAEGVSKLMSGKMALNPAVDAVVARWMHLKILTGFVCHCELKADTGKDWPPLTNSFVRAPRAAAAKPSTAREASR